jgi:hypothetical protein
VQLPDDATGELRFDLVVVDAAANLRHEPLVVRVAP